MISRETENVQSAKDVEAAFRALTPGDKPFITANELFAVSSFCYKEVHVASKLVTTFFLVKRGVHVLYTEINSPMSLLQLITL